MRKVRLLVAAIALGTLAVPPMAEAKTRPQTVRFTVPFDDEGSMPYGIHQCGVERMGVCDVKFDGHTTLRGDGWVTFADYFGHGHGDPMTRKFYGESWDRHTGSVKGCGSGSFVMQQRIVGDFNTYDPVKGTYRLDIEWTILPGSGSGDFTDATGEGTAEGQATLQFANKGSYTGSITCPRGKAVASR
ncbi:MAG TPA: hypothetical protein VNA12_06240 [Mycobacteriales bacterium]|nr:hypothetical protein [Mycobacteriales bacterium]